MFSGILIVASAKIEKPARNVDYSSIEVVDAGSGAKLVRLPIENDNYIADNNRGINGDLRVI